MRITLHMFGFLTSEGCLQYVEKQGYIKAITRVLKPLSIHTIKEKDKITIMGSKGDQVTDKKIQKMIKEIKRIARYDIRLVSLEHSDTGCK